MSIRCPECLTWFPKMDQRQPFSTVAQRPYCHVDSVYECHKCGEKYTESEGKLWIEGEFEEAES